MPEVRIVAGEWRGRRIAVPAGAVRPTADRVREAWLSIVRPALDGARVVDLCAGTGALGLEALSRGAAHCDFVEQSPTVLRTLEANLATLGAGARAAVHRRDALGFVGERAPEGADAPWDVAFADPPYREGVALALAERWLRAPFATIFGVEHETALTLPAPAAGGTATAERRAYGDTTLTFYRLPT
ncbi:MAG: 16S rRNA (guanine(966)-N(2))-methyltransferase RsmD [Gemmatimonadaceae bacterium]